MKKLFTIFLLTAALTSGAQNIWRAPSVFEQWVNFNALATQKSGTDTLFIRTVGANTTLNHGLGTLLLNNSKAAMGFFDATGYRIAAGADNIQHQQGSTDSLIEKFVSDTMEFTATVAAFKFTPKLDANSVTGFWGTSGNTGTNPSTNFIGTADNVDLNISRRGVSQIAMVYETGTGSSVGIRDSLGVLSLISTSNNQGTYHQIKMGDHSREYGNTVIGVDLITSRVDIIADTLIIINGTQGAGKILTSDAAGNATWQLPTGTITVDSIAATGATVSPAVNTTHVITSAGAITSATLSFPAGTTGNFINVIFNKAISTLTNSGVGAGLVSLVAPSLGTSKLYVNIGGNWY